GVECDWVTKVTKQKEANSSLNMLFMDVDFSTVMGIFPCALASVCVLGTNGVVCSQCRSLTTKVTGAGARQGGGYKQGP
ncbi:hypothetical protein WNB94_17120, partial [Aquabacterium sp. A3]|uniref:hypothetical protein n=1 Tax=Aquabacterium sp. A3 TaxID=3132829 RepID=UPI0031192738